MSTRLRQALPLVALAVLLVPGAQRLLPASGVDRAEPPQRLERFPARVRAESPPLPPFGARLWDRAEQQKGSADEMWRSAFAAAGDEYHAAKLVEPGATRCGELAEAWAGMYCWPEELIVLDLEGHLQRQSVTGPALSDLVLGYIVAHEVGHHVQTLRGAPRADSTRVALRRELHADCLAGVWGKAAGVALPPIWAYGTDEIHGTKAQRIRWLGRGHRRARPADCDAIWSGEPL